MSLLGNEFEIVDDTTGGTGSGGGGTGGSGGQTELSCTDGADDDGDGLPDCDDPDCDARARCVPATPDTWSGPAILFGGPGSAPACPADYATLAYQGFGLSYEPADCEPCACTDPEFTCTPYQIYAYDEANCQGNATTLFYTATCSGISGQPRSFLTGPPMLNMVSNCQAEGGTLLDMPPPVWSDAAVCELTAEAGAGCDGAATCLPLSEQGDFLPGICVWKAGDNDCPAGFDDKYLFHEASESVTDTRDCETCSCEFTGACSASTDVYEDGACAFLAGTVPHTSGGCTTLPNDATGASVIWNVAPVGGCTPSGGAVGDVVAESAATTVCCSQ